MFCPENTPTLISAAAPSQTPLGELAPLIPLAGFKGTDF